MKKIIVSEIKNIGLRKTEDCRAYDLPVLAIVALEDNHFFSIDMEGPFASLYEELHIGQTISFSYEKIIEDPCILKSGAEVTFYNVVGVNLSDLTDKICAMCEYDTYDRRIIHAWYNKANRIFR